MKDRLKNTAVWVYIIANVLLVTTSAISFIQGYEVVGYVMVGAEVVVNTIASINNPDFKGLIKDKKFIVSNAEKVANIINKIYEATQSNGDE